MSKILITERQYRVLLEYNFPKQVRRRLDRENLQKKVDSAQGWSDDTCHFYDGYEYADYIIDNAVDEFFDDFNEDFIDNVQFMDIRDDMIMIFKDEFGGDLVEYYERVCVDKPNLI